MPTTTTTQRAPHLPPLPMAATPAKLRDGSWGARVAGIVRPGDVVRIVARSGKTWDATVARVLWTGDDVMLVSTSSSSSSGSSRSGSSLSGRGTWTGCRCGSVEEYARNSDCSSCRHDRY